MSGLEEPVVQGISPAELAMLAEEMTAEELREQFVRLYRSYLVTVDVLGEVLEDQHELRAEFRELLGNHRVTLAGTRLLLDTLGDVCSILTEMPGNVVGVSNLITAAFVAFRTATDYTPEPRTPYRSPLRLVSWPDEELAGGNRDD